MKFTTAPYCVPCPPFGMPTYLHCPTNADSKGIPSAPEANATPKTTEKVKAVKITTKMSKNELETWIKSNTSGISQLQLKIEELATYKGSRNYRLHAETLPDENCLFELGSWNQIDELAVVRMERESPRFEQKFTNKEQGLSHLSTSMANVEWLTNKLKSLYGNDHCIDVVEFSGFEHIKDKVFYVVEVERADKGDVDDKVTPYCNKNKVRVRPWRNRLPGRSRKLIELK